MGMDCHGLNGGGFSANWSGWSCLLDAALENGWERRGTRSCVQNGFYFEGGFEWSDEPEDRVGDGYMGNNFQLVDEEDAANLADALERAIDSGAFKTRPEYEVNEEDAAKFGSLMVSVDEQARELMALARRGAFYLL